jgi:predicted flap endonuclease-1-like 5' DNA nuclease
MIRTILGLIAGMVLAFIGVFFFVWVLWWLWTRLSPEKAAVSIEIEAQPPETTEEAEADEEPATEVQPKTKAPGPPTARDDLKRIEGIGPKFSSILQEAGILTYAQLAAASADELESILKAKDPRLLRLADPVAWREQAALAATGEWEALEALQGKLKGGRRA